VELKNPGGTRTWCPLPASEIIKRAEEICPPTDLISAPADVADAGYMAFFALWCATVTCADTIEAFASTLAGLPKLADRVAVVEALGQVGLIALQYVDDITV
jgi:hypothetical protein